LSGAVSRCIELCRQSHRSVGAVAFGSVSFATEKRRSRQGQAAEQPSYARQDGAPPDQGARACVWAFACGGGSARKGRAGPDDRCGRAQELNEFEKNSPDWCTVGCVDDDLMHWNAMVAGPVRPLAFCAVAGWRWEWERATNPRCRRARRTRAASSASTCSSRQSTRSRPPRCVASRSMLAAIRYSLARFPTSRC